MSQWFKRIWTGLLPTMALCVLSLNAGATTVTMSGSGGSGTAEDVLFQNLKTFLGATNAANIQAANILLYMLPPFYDITVAVTARFDAGEGAKQKWQQTQLRDIAMYNMMTQQQSSQQVVSARIANCVNTQGKPAKYCDYTVANSGNDVLASSLLDTLAFENDTQRLAATQYIKNLTNYTPLVYPGDSAVFQDPKNKENGLTQAGITYFSAAFQTQALMTMAQNALLDIFSDRTRFQNFGSGLPVGNNGNASIMEMLYYEVSRRYMNQNWYTQMSQSSDSAMLREIANMMALQSYMQLKQYEQGAQIEALLAAQVSIAAQTATKIASSQANTNPVDTSTLTAPLGSK